MKTLIVFFLHISIFVKGSLYNPRTVARSGSNISLACGGVSSSSYIYLIEWVCLGCDCGQCPSHSNNGLRLLRYNDKITQWDNSYRRTLDKRRYGLEFSPVTVQDSGVYYCFINNRLDSSPVELIVQDSPEPPPHRPMISSISSRSVLLTWAVPLNDNHDPINSYKIYVRENSQAHPVEIDTGLNETRFLVTGLQPFTTYSFRVAAQNNIGYSLPSKESFQTQTHRERPSGSPTFIRSKISTLSTSLDVYWEPPTQASINGEFLGYILTVKPENSRETKKIEIRDESFKTQNYSLNGLLRHTNYIITVAAKNLEGLGPEATIQLRTEDGVPLQPRDLTVKEVLSSELDIAWRPPSNADILGSQLLGYRVYIREVGCNDGIQEDTINIDSSECVEKKTISDAGTTSFRIGYLKPATAYELSVSGFTGKREGSLSDSRKVTTDTAKPSPPIITNVNCTGNGDILVEWRRSRIIHGKIDYFILYYKSPPDDSYYKRKIDVSSTNTSDLYLTQLTNLNNFTTYNLAISAITASRQTPGKLYESQFSSYHQIFVSPGCELRTEMVSVFAREGINMLMIAVVLAIITSIMMILGIALCCRRKGDMRQYEIVSVLSPSKYLTSAGLMSAKGWRGEAASDIPSSLFPKHVQGLHASGNLAFVKDFEAFQQPDNEWRGSEFVTVTVDTWETAGGYINIFSSSPLSDRTVWRTIWDNQVELLVTFIPTCAKDDLALFSSSKFIGSYQLQLEAEKEMGDFIVRTLKVRNRGSTRTVTQLVFMSWPETNSGMSPSKSSFLALIRESSQIVRQTHGSGPVMIWSPQDMGTDPAIYWMCLDTMTRQMRATGDTNLSHYSRYLAVRHQLQLSSSQLYIQLHDMLAWAIQHHKLGEQNL